MVEGLLVETREDTRDSNGTSRPDAPVPGVAVVFEQSATWRAVAVGEAPLLIGRGPDNGVVLTDDLASREHVSVAWDDGTWTVTDLGSRNGTSLDGKRLTGAASGPWRCLRVGHTLLVPIDDLRLRGPVRLEAGRVIGAALGAALERVRVAAESGRTLTIFGESGTGKELAARTYHQASRPQGPLMSVNCAAIPHGVAERLLYGAKRGAYSEAKENAAGYFQAAHRGVLFLDEVGELAAEVQAKLLRTIETGEVLALGAVQVEQVDVLVCCATNRDLEAAVAGGQLRADLYYRLIEAQVRLPPLRARAEELPWHIAAEVERSAAGLPVSPRFIEACLLRDWPGNVRELLAEVRAAVDEARLTHADQLRSAHLRATAGERARVEVEAPKPQAASPKHVTREQLQAAIDENGTIAAAARALGLHRTQVYRLMADFGMKLEK
jgi:transcriptional regulator with GAF, ATPase, and Fis domain